MQKGTRPAIGFEPVPAEGGGMGQWDGNPPRPPKKGEFYLSGAGPSAWRAPNDFSTAYYIARVSTDAKTKPFTVIGESRTDKTIDQIAEEIGQLAHDLRRGASASTMAGHAQTIMHLAADIIITAKAQEAGSAQ